MTATVTNSPRVFRQMKVGAGGYVLGFDQHADGTLVCKSDVGGAFLWNATKQAWAPLITSNSMPAADVSYYNFEYSSQGCAEIRIAPSNSNIFYMIQGGYVYRSGNKGATWTKCPGFAQGLCESNGGGIGHWTQRMAIDPINSNVVYAGTQTTGLFQTLDGGQTSVSMTSRGFPVSTPGGSTHPGPSGIIFDPTSATANGRTSTLWASSDGFGYYRSTDGGATWAKPTGGPTSGVRDASFSSTGVLYAIDNFGSNFWKWSAGAWTAISDSALTNQPAACVLVDPNDATRLIGCAGGGNIQESNDSGATWGAINFTNVSKAATDVPWLAVSGNYMSAGMMRFDKITANKILFCDGIGFWTTTIANGALKAQGNSYALTWTSMSAGIENLVSTGVLTTPASTLSPVKGNLMISALDRPIYKITDPEVYPSDYQLKNFTGSGTTLSVTLDNCYGMDYCASNPDIIYATSLAKSGKSTDGGASFTLFGTLPAFGSGVGGHITVGSPNVAIWSPGNNKNPARTTDGGATWSNITISGVVMTNYYAGGGIHRATAADRVTANKFYMHFYTEGLYVSTDSGANWTQQFNGPVLPFTGFASKLKTTEGKAGHLWFTQGDQGGTPGEAPSGPFVRSVDSGVTWSTVADLLEIYDFDFGAKQTPGQAYPTVWIVGSVNGNYGVYYSTDAADTPGVMTWTKVADWPNANYDAVYCLGASKTQFGLVYVGFQGTGWCYSTSSAAGMISLQMRI